MKVIDILRVKGSTLFTVQPDQPLAEAATKVVHVEEQIAVLRAPDGNIVDRKKNG